MTDRPPKRDRVRDYTLTVWAETRRMTKGPVDQNGVVYEVVGPTQKTEIVVRVSEPGDDAFFTAYLPVEQARMWRDTIGEVVTKIEQEEEGQHEHSASVDD